MARAKSLSAAKKAIEAAQKEYETAKEAQALRLGHMMLDAGFEDVELPDSKAKEVCEQAFERFRSEPNSSP